MTLQFYSPRQFAFAVSCTVAFGVMGGCGTDSGSANSGGPAVGATGGEYASLVLASMPTGEVATPTDIKERGGDAADTVLAGRIDAGDMDPFQPGEIAFIISQLPDEEHASDDPDHEDNCPFCKHLLENAPKAIVQFHAADGSVLSGDARQSLALEKGDVVYVTGSAQFDSALNTVMVDATGVFKKSAL